MSRRYVSLTVIPATLKTERGVEFLILVCEAACVTTKIHGACDSLLAEEWWCLGAGLRFEQQNREQRFGNRLLQKVF